MKILISITLLLLSTISYAANTDIFNAARTGDLTAINQYIEQDGDLDARNEEGYTLFILAAYYGQQAILETLAENQANACAVDERGSNAFMGVAFKGDVNTAEWLLQHTTCDIDQQNYAGQTALMMAALFGHEAMIQLLLENGADSAHIDQQGNTATSLAQGQGLSDVVAILAQQPNADDNDDVASDE